jgi:hypothetical protein
MQQPQRVFVLLDRGDPPNVYAVTSDEEVAEAWLGYDGTFGVVETEVDDFTMVNAIADEVEESEEKLKKA